MVVIALLFVATGIGMARTKVSFDADGALPKGWESGITGKGAAKWDVAFNGKKLFEVEDDTFKDTGAVGVWTKADSVTLFDDFTFGAK